LYKVRAERLVCDAHPGYTTHRWAHQQQDLAVETVWHHQAHASALTAEHGLRTTSLVFTWDGVGLGEDGTLWGGDALLGRSGAWRRVSRLRPFRLPGGVRAGREPWRSAAALLWETGRAWHEATGVEQLAKAAWQADLNCPTTTAAGRLFDAAAAIILGLDDVSYEAAGPMQLEALCQRRRDPVSLPLEKCDDGLWQSDWEPLLEMLTDHSLPTITRAEVLHASLAQSIVSQARVIRDDSGITQVGLCGGVFQNRVLTEHVVALLRDDEFTVFIPERLPCNDAALCVGQAAELAARSGTEQH
jgi:hydrogenase maturation protein HypF